MPTRSLYQVLEVTPAATEDAIKAAYRKLARQLHPDRTGGDAKKTERFKLVNDAYAILGDKAKRAEYDKASKSSQGLVDMMFGEEASTLVDRLQTEGITSANLDSLIEDFFSMAGNVHRKMPDRMKNVQPKDILETWETLFRGK